MPVQKCSRRNYRSRVAVPRGLRRYVKRCEIVRSLRTADRTEARVANLFHKLRRDARFMDSRQIEALVAQVLDTELHEVEERLALGGWKINGAHWNDTARHVLLEKIDELQEALADNDLRGTLDDARRMSPGLSDSAQRILASRLLEVRIEACLAELRGIDGEPIRRTVIAPRAPDAAQQAPKGSTLLSVAAAAWLDSKKLGGKMNAKALSRLAGMARTVCEMVGDKAVGSAT